MESRYHPGILQRHDVSTRIFARHVSVNRTLSKDFIFLDLLLSYFYLVINLLLYWNSFWACGELYLPLVGVHQEAVGSGFLYWLLRDFHPLDRCICCCNGSHLLWWFLNSLDLGGLTSEHFEKHLTAYWRCCANCLFH